MASGEAEEEEDGVGEGDEVTDEDVKTVAAVFEVVDNVANDGGGGGGGGQLPSGEYTTGRKVANAPPEAMVLRQAVRGSNGGGGREAELDSVARRNGCVPDAMV
jgi:hypothetical protein